MALRAFHIGSPSLLSVIILYILKRIYIYPCDVTLVIFNQYPIVTCGLVGKDRKTFRKAYICIVLMEGLDTYETN